MEPGLSVGLGTPWNISMEPENHLFEKKGQSSEPNLHDFGFKMLISRGVP